MSYDDEHAHYLNGPAFVGWLSEHGFERTDVDPSGSLWSKWEGGQRVRVARADAVLTEFGYHLTELPDHVWLAPQTKHAGAR